MYLKEKFWLQNFQVHIGDSHDYTKNTACPGGPFLKTDDSKNYNADSASWDKVWSYGKEMWCDLEGQYVSLVADLSVL